MGTRKILLFVTKCIYFIQHISQQCYTNTQCHYHRYHHKSFNLLISCSILEKRVPIAKESKKTNNTTIYNHPILSLSKFLNIQAISEVLITINKINIAFKNPINSFSSSILGILFLLVHASYYIKYLNICQSNHVHSHIQRGNQRKLAVYITGGVN